MILKGQTIQLIEKTQTGVDGFDRPTYQETEISVENVLIAPLSDTEVLDTLNLTGKKAVYHLAIPKGDTHTWENRKVRFFGETWRVIGKPTKGIDDLIPLDWNLKVKVESIEGD